MKAFLPFVLFAFSAAAQQVSDTSFHPQIADPLFEQGKGPVVFLDEAHYNFHRVDGRYAPFCKVLRADGFVVQPNRAVFSAKTLAKCKVLVIANALNEANSEEWALPTPSAFTAKEIAAVKKWVEKGGSLFLIADHMPFAGAASELAGAFGFTFENGFALQNIEGSDLFSHENGGLTNDTLIAGLTQVRTFTGQGFGCPEAANPLLVLDSTFTLHLPETAWEFETNCPTRSAAGLVQMAYMPYGKGKLVFSGEAAMFSAQVSDGNRFGLTAEDAKDNLELLRRLMGWLAL
jgi:hypothetical protein